MVEPITCLRAGAKFACDTYTNARHLRHGRSGPEQRRLHSVYETYAEEASVSSRRRTLAEGTLKAPLTRAGGARQGAAPANVRKITATGDQPAIS